MKNTLFNVSRILAVLVMIGVLSMIGAGNPKILPYFVIFFVVVFGIIYLLNKTAKQGERAGKAGAGANPVIQLIVVVLFVAIASLLGYLRHGIPGYLVVFAALSAILALIYLAIKNRQRHFELTDPSPVRKMILLAVMALLTLGLPLLMVITSDIYEPAFKPILLTVIGLLLFITLIAAALILVNRLGGRVYSVAGYFLVILAAVLPGLFVLMQTNESQAFTTPYLAALITAVLTYLTLNMVYKID